MLCGCSVLCDNPCTPAITACNACGTEGSSLAESLVSRPTRNSAKFVRNAPLTAATLPVTAIQQHAIPWLHALSRSAPLARASSPPPANPPTPTQTCCRPAPASATGDTEPTPGVLLLGQQLSQTQPASQHQQAFSTTVTFKAKHSAGHRRSGRILRANPTPAAARPAAPSRVDSQDSPLHAAPASDASAANAAKAESDCA